MRKLSKALGVAILLVLGGVTAATAADGCITDGFGQVLVGKSLSLPAANACKPFNGFINNTYTTLNGNVCKTHDNAFYIFNIQFGYHSDGGQVVFYLNTGSLAGQGKWLNYDTGSNDGFVDTTTFTKTLCPAVRRFGP
jgi:hypothetical protein